MNDQTEKQKSMNKCVDLLDGLIDGFGGGMDVELLRLVAMICMVPKCRLKNKKVLKMIIKQQFYSYFCKNIKKLRFNEKI